MRHLYPTQWFTCLMSFRPVNYTKPGVMPEFQSCTRKLRFPADPAGQVSGWILFPSKKTAPPLGSDPLDDRGLFAVQCRSSRLHFRSTLNTRHKFWSECLYVGRRMPRSRGATRQRGRPKRRFMDGVNEDVCEDRDGR